MYKKEFDLLLGLPHAAQVEYLLVRSAMDWEDCVAGNRGDISWGGLATYLHVYGQPGISGEVFSMQQARRLAGHLIKRGLITLLSQKGKRGGDTDSLKFFFPIVAQCKSAQKKADSKPTAKPDSKPTAQEPHNTRDLGGLQEESRQGQNDESRQISVVSINTHTHTQGAFQVFLDKGQGETVLTIEFGNGHYEITDADLATAQTAYPQIDVKKAIQQGLMGQLMARRPCFSTADDAKLYLHRWLRKDNDMAIGKLKPASRPYFGGNNGQYSNQGGGASSGNPGAPKNKVADALAEFKRKLRAGKTSLPH